MSLRQSTVSRTSFPNITTPQISYSQRYQHMTKLANYNELNEAQIWREYQKLRQCLKELNQEVLYHMEKKAYKNINAKEKQKYKVTKDTEGTLILIEDEKKTNELRMSNFQQEYNNLEDRIKYLTSKSNYLDELQNEAQQIKQKIKFRARQNKDLKRNAEMQGRDLINNNSILDKVMIEEGKMTVAFKQHKKHQATVKLLDEKTSKYKDRIVELQRAIEVRIQQFSKQENYIEEEIHFEQYQELQSQKEVIQKYEPIYKRNYLMKLKELENLINSVGKHDKVINETQANNVAMRSEIDQISLLVGTARKRYNSSLQVSNMPRRPSRSSRDANMTGVESSHLIHESKQNQIKNQLKNDKNQPNQRQPVVVVLKKE